MKIVLENKSARIINNGDTIFSCQYNQLLGQIKGIRFETKGSGAFDYVRLSNSSGKQLFVDNFNN